MLVAVGESRWESEMECLVAVGEAVGERGWSAGGGRRGSWEWRGSTGEGRGGRRKRGCGTGDGRRGRPNAGARCGLGLRGCGSRCLVCPHMRHPADQGERESDAECECHDYRRAPVSHVGHGPLRIGHAFLLSLLLPRALSCGRPPKKRGSMLQCAGTSNWAARSMAPPVMGKVRINL